MLLIKLSVWDIIRSHPGCEMEIHIGQGDIKVDSELTVVKNGSVLLNCFNSCVRHIVFELTKLSNNSLIKANAFKILCSIS